MFVYFIGVPEKKCTGPRYLGPKGKHLAHSSLMIYPQTKKLALYLHT